MGAHRTGKGKGILKPQLGKQLQCFLFKKQKISIDCCWMSFMPNKGAFGSSSLERKYWMIENRLFFFFYLGLLHYKLLFISTVNLKLPFFP